MPSITPLAAIPVTAPSGVAAASLYEAPPGQLLWIEGRVTAGTVGLRPYYWSPQLGSSTGLGGAWIALGGDATAGTNPVSFDAADYGGTAQGSYEWRRSGASVVLVKVNDVGSAFDFVHINTELQIAGQ